MIVVLALPAVLASAGRRGSPTRQAARGRASAFQDFTVRIVALRGVDFGLERSPEAALRADAAALDAIGDAKEYTAQKRAFLYGVFSAGGFAKGEFVQYAGMNAAQQAA